MSSIRDKRKRLLANPSGIKEFTISTRESGGKTTYMLRASTGASSISMGDWMNKGELQGWINQNTPQLTSEAQTSLFNQAGARMADFKNPASYAQNKLLQGTAMEQGIAAQIPPASTATPITPTTSTTSSPELAKQALSDYQAGKMTPTQYNQKLAQISQGGTNIPTATQPQPSGVPTASMGATNLWEFYTKQGKALPTVEQRTPLYQQYGGTGTYMGTAEQNTFLLGKLKGGLPATKAPETSTGITTTPSTNLPTTTPTTGDITSAQGKLAMLSSTNNDYINQYTQNLTDFAKQKQGLASWLMDQTKNYESQAELRAKLETQYDVKGKLAEIDSLGQEYNKNKASMQTDIENSANRMATTGFISREQAAIERRYAPTLNRISADINLKTGLITQSRDLIDQAVKDSVADQKYKLDTAKMFYDLNIDAIDSLEDAYKDAYKEYMRQEEQAYDRAYDEKKLIGNLAVDNPNAGITLSDSYETAVSKVVASGGSLAYQREQRLASGETGTGTSTNAFLDVMQEAINQGATPEQAARAAATISEQSGIQVNQDILNSWVSLARSLTPTSTQATESTTTPTTSIFKPYTGSPGSEYPQPSWMTSVQTSIGSFFNNLFGG